mgnify:CR=1 FL=1
MNSKQYKKLEKHYNRLVKNKTIKTLNECLVYKLAIDKAFSLQGVVVPKGTCCLKPKKIGKVNDMFESWDECKNCGKEVL